MEFKKITAPTLKELFIDQLETMILSGQLEIGEKLPPERELAASMQVSRSVVNSGISDLADKGFIDIVPRSGNYVTDYRKKGKIETLISIMKYNGGKLPDSDIRSILEIREVLMTLTLQMAIPIMSSENMHELWRLAAELDNTQDPVYGAQIIFDFDHILCCASGNTLLPLIFYSFKSPNTQLLERFFRLHGFQAMRERTNGLCSAIQNGETNAAISIIKVSIENTLNGKTSLYI